MKHMEFIQGVINRMASNSFLIKGWAITIVAALFALAAKDTEKSMLYMAYIPIPAFWILDGFYLWQERLYRELWKEVIQKQEKQIDFSMNAYKFNGFGKEWIHKWKINWNKEWKLSWGGSVISETLVWFYLPLIFAIWFIIKVIK
jgi:hypothetical protein